MTPEMKGFLLLSVLKMVFVFTFIMVGVALLTLMERKVSAWMQNRRGPNRVGWAGLLQPAADGVKNILKEETYPALANRWLFVLAISSMGVYGIALAGWSSNSKYALLGGLRASAQMISYEVAMGLSLIPVLLMSGNVSFDAIIRDQQEIGRAHV